MASHPTFDPNRLDAEGDTLSQDENSPLLNRATQGLYPLGDAYLPILRELFRDDLPTGSGLLSFYNELGVLREPIISMPVAQQIQTDELDDLRASPLQVSLFAAALSNHGTIPAPRIATAVNTRDQGWVVLPALDEPRVLTQPSVADEAALSFLDEDGTFWSHTAKGSINKVTVSWYIAGTPPDWQGPPLSLVVAVEEDNAGFVQRVGKLLLDTALNQ
jgi:hypothetical protein